MIGQYWGAAIHGGGNSLTAPRDRVGNSLLDAPATMAKTDLVGPAIGLVAFTSVILCVVGWKRGWCCTEGESEEMRRLLNLRLAERYV